MDNESLRNLEKLHQLKTDGIITEAEFEQSKEKLLHGIGKTPAVASVPQTTPAADNWIGWMTLPLRRYAQFTGRSGRKEFWLFLLFTNLVSLGLALLVAIGTSNVDGEASMSPMANLSLGILILGVLGMLVPVIAAEVRRFHDQDRSGWFALLNLIPYVGWAVVLVFMLLEGTRGDNRFGSDPRAQ